MTTDLTMLVWTAVLCLLMAMPYTVGLIGQLGLPRMAGNRDDIPAVEGWIGRAKRAHANLVENLAPFAVLVLVAHVSGQHNATTALGAQIFFFARLAHAACYYAGIPWSRTGAYAAGLDGELMILLQIIS